MDILSLIICFRPLDSAVTLRQFYQNREIITNYYQGVFLHRNFGMKLNEMV
jgi:hypothetical protein